jgi:hypothetical protein
MSLLFKPVEWSYQTNLYEVNLRQYTHEGTFKAFAKQLPRLRGMGIETLWLMPITPISIAGRQGSRAVIMPVPITQALILNSDQWRISSLVKRARHWDLK